MIDIQEITTFLRYRLAAERKALSEPPLVCRAAAEDLATSQGETTAPPVVSQSADFLHCSVLADFSH